MPDDNINAKTTGRQSSHIGQSSQDAARHEKDALHHKFHNTSQRSGVGAKNDEQSQASTQQDSGDAQPGEGQPEIPKVGSRDAPGG